MAFPPQQLPSSSSLLKLQRQDTKNLHRRNGTSSTFDDDDDCYDYGAETSYFQRFSSSLTGYSENSLSYPLPTPPPPSTLTSPPLYSSDDDDLTIHSTVLGSGLSLYELTEKLTKNPYLWVEFRQLLKDESVVTDVGVFVYLNRFVAEHLDEIMMEVELENEEKKRKEKEKGGAFERFKRASVDMLSGRWTGNSTTPGGPLGSMNPTKRRGTMGFFASTAEGEETAAAAVPDDTTWAKMNASESWIGNQGGVGGRGSISMVQYEDNNDTLARMHASDCWGEGAATTTTTRRSSLIDIGGMFSGYLTSTNKMTTTDGDIESREAKAMAQLCLSEDEFGDNNKGVEGKGDDKSALSEANTNAFTSVTSSTKSSSEQQQQQQQQFGSSFGMLFNGGSFQSSDNNADNPTSISPQPSPPEGPPPTTAPSTFKRPTTMNLLSNKLSSLLGNEVIPAPAPQPPLPPKKPDMFRSEPSLPRYPSVHARRSQSDPPQHTRTLSGLSKTGRSLPLPMQPPARVRSASLRPRTMSGDEFEMCKELSDESDGDGEEEVKDMKDLIKTREMTNVSRQNDNNNNNNTTTTTNDITTPQTNTTNKFPPTVALSRQSSKTKLPSRRRSSMSSITSAKSTENKSKSRRRSSMSSQTIDSTGSTPSRRPSLSRTERRRRRSSLKLMENMDSDEDEENDKEKTTRRFHRRPSVNATSQDKTTKHHSEDANNNTKSKTRRRRPSMSIATPQQHTITTPTTSGIDTDTTQKTRPLTRLYPTTDNESNSDTGYSINSRQSTSRQRRSSRLASAMSKIVSQRNMNDEETDTDNNETEIRLRSVRGLETIVGMSEEEFFSDGNNNNNKSHAPTFRYKHMTNSVLKPPPSRYHQERTTTTWGGGGGIMTSDSESSTSLIGDRRGGSSFMERRLKSHREKMSSQSRSLNRINALRRNSSRTGGVTMMMSDSEILREEEQESAEEKKPREEEVVMGVESDNGSRILGGGRQGSSTLRALSRLSSRRRSDSDAMLDVGSTMTPRSSTSRLVSRRKSDGEYAFWRGGGVVSSSDCEIGGLARRLSARNHAEESSSGILKDQSALRRSISRDRSSRGTSDSEVGGLQRTRSIRRNSSSRVSNSSDDNNPNLMKDQSGLRSVRSISRDRSMRITSDSEVGGLQRTRSIRRNNSSRVPNSSDDNNDAGKSLMKDQSGLRSVRSISRDRSMRITSDSEVGGLQRTRSIRRNSSSRVPNSSDDNNDASKSLMKDQSGLRSVRSISRDRSMRITSDSEIGGTLTHTRSLRNTTTTSLSSTTTARDRRTRSSFSEGINGTTTHSTTVAGRSIRNNSSVVQSRLTQASDGDLNGGISQDMRELRAGRGVSARQRRVSGDGSRGMAAAAAVAGR